MRRFTGVLIGAVLAVTAGCASTGTRRGERLLAPAVSPFAQDFPLETIDTQWEWHPTEKIR